MDTSAPSTPKRMSMARLPDLSCGAVYVWVSCVCDVGVAGGTSVDEYGIVGVIVEGCGGSYIKVDCGGIEAAADGAGVHCCSCRGATAMLTENGIVDIECIRSAIEVLTGRARVDVRLPVAKKHAVV